jgi:hypothetical protein
MRHLVVASTAVIAIATGAVWINSGTQAATFGGLNAALHGLATVEKTQFIFEGHRHCWYADGWHGPGWYWCGYRHRNGVGWGGPEGWHGWRHEERQ